MPHAPRYLARHRNGGTYQARDLTTLCVGMLAQWGVEADVADLREQLDEDHATAFVHEDGADFPHDVLVTVLDRERVGP